MEIHGGHNRILSEQLATILTVSEGNHEKIDYDIVILKVIDFQLNRNIEDLQRLKTIAVSSDKA